jgi:hypothetical protein
MSDARIRVIADTLYERENTPYAYTLKLHTLGLHVEAVALPAYRWFEVDRLSDPAIADLRMAEGHSFSEGEWLPAAPTLQDTKLAYAAENSERSARRARAAVRRRVKLFELNSMLTLTYAENVLDRDRMRRDVDAMIKRIRRVIPDFAYVCVFEQQKRGAWHAHIATRTIQSHYLHRGKFVQSYALLRLMWRAVTGAAGGNIDVSRGRGVKRSTGRLAGYLAKYIGKGFADGQIGDSYSASGSLPRPTTQRYVCGSLQAASDELIRLVLEAFPGMCELYACAISDHAYYCARSPLYAP